MITIKRQMFKIIQYLFHFIFALLNNRVHEYSEIPQMKNKNKKNKARRKRVKNGRVLSSKKSWTQYLRSYPWK
jgi:hypothetical protein